MATEMTDEDSIMDSPLGTWVLGCGSCKANFYVKNCGLVTDKDEPCDSCKIILTGEDDHWGDHGVAAELGWCGCGSPEKIDNLMLLYLADVERKAEAVKDDTTLLLAYVADKAGWVEHGGSIYGGWLTDDGQEALTNLRLIVGARAD